MKIWNILIKENEQDAFSIQAVQNEDTMDFCVGHHSSVLQSNAKELMRQNDFVLSVNANDFLNFAVAVYSVDQLISRKAFGFQGWSRHIKVYFPVANTNVWIHLKNEMEQMLSFLSGDKWELFFRQCAVILPVQNVINRNPNCVTKVSLLSGGLDSFISAIDLLSSNEKVAFVSHYKKGSESPKQTALYSALETKFGSQEFLKNQFYVQPNQSYSKASKEDSSRARSFLFLVLGVSVAHALGDHIELVVPENGLISLNVPLTQTRLSSHSTRTTHPFYLKAFQTVVQGLGIQNRIHNPYQFKTKGEMMNECLDKAFLQQQYMDTLSCSHPDNSRFVKGKRPGIHCGYCVPCIIRQAAENAAGGIRTVYAHQIKSDPPNHNLKKGRDMRAFKMALEEIKSKPHHSLVLRIMRSGPLPFGTQDDLNDFVSIYERGMSEVRNFLY